MSNQADHTIVRLRVPPELKEKIEKSAEKNNRSQSAEMVSRLEESFNQTNKSLEDLSADELIYFIFNKLNKRGLALTVEEIERGKQLSRKSEK